MSDKPQSYASICSSHDPFPYEPVTGGVPVESSTTSWPSISSTPSRLTKKERRAQIRSVFALKQQHISTWRDRSEWYWTLGLLEEVLELLLSLCGLHEGPVDWELQQIASIAMNWLEMRAQRRPKN